MKGADEKFDTSKVFKEVMKGFTDVIGITIEQFGYTHNNQSFSVQGRTDLSFDEHSVKPKLARFDSDYKITADKSLVREVAKFLMTASAIPPHLSCMVRLYRLTTFRLLT